VGNIRNSALENGFLIGSGLASFGAGWVAHYFYGYMTKLVSIITELAPGDTELLIDIERLKASGDKALLTCIIVGVVLLAIGIGREAYQRAKRQNG
jgi:hypothetical protein